MRRRCLAAVVGVGLVAWPFLSKAPAPAQTLPVIGFLNSVSSNKFGNRLAAFHQGLADTGYAEGRNVAIEYRWADGHYDRLPALAADLVRRNVNVIVGA